MSHRACLIDVSGCVKESNLVLVNSWKCDLPSSHFEIGNLCLLALDLVSKCQSLKFGYWILCNFFSCLSGEFWVGQANQDLVKIFFFHFSSWAWSTPWGHVLSLITFRQIPVLSWAIRYSVFQKVKFTSSLQKWAGNVNLNYWHLVVKFGHNGWF